MTNYRSELAALKVPLEVAIKYDSKFKPEHIAKLVRAKIGPEIANAYRLESRFGCDYIVSLARAGVMPDVANKYADLLKTQWPPGKAIDDIIALAKDQVEPECAKSFDQRKFTLRNIRVLAKKKIDASVANAYPFSGREVIALVAAQVSPEQVKGYQNAGIMESHEIMLLAKHEIAADRALQYHGFTVEAICTLATHGVSPDLAKAYNRSAEVMVAFVKKGVSPEMAKKYATFDPGQALVLLEEGVSPEYADCVRKIFGIEDSMLFNRVPHIDVEIILACKQLGLSLARFKKFLNNRAK
ncbi:hypothetical protein HY492_01150 [Candidatus Woesearchaeota archaeon]|nr:hypothetical protein [Candidatus Woesearchaeota archaeon]